MAGTLFPVNGNVPGQATLVFSFAGNGTSDPDASSIRGSGCVSVKRNTTGRYDIVLDSGVYRVIGGFASVNPASNSVTATTVSCASVYVDETTSPLSFSVWTAGGNGTVADAPAGSRVWVSIQVQLSAGA